MPKSNEEIERLFNEWADLLDITGGDPFRVRSYQKAARAVGGYSKDCAQLSERELRQIPNVGAHMAARMLEYCQTGRMHELDELREHVPPGLRDLLSIPGLGAKKAVLLHQELGVTSIAELTEAIQAERLRGIRGLGAKTEENLARAIEHLQSHGERIPLDAALKLAEQILAELAGHPQVKEAGYAGSLRRMRETIGDIDVLIASDAAEQVMDAFVALPVVERPIARGDTKCSVMTERGLQVDLRVVPPDSWGAALQYFTGSKAHNVKVREMAVRKGLKLSEYGLFRVKGDKRIASRTEEEVYEALGLPWIPPTMREDTGEVEAALAGTLPTPLDVRDIRGDLHTHTNLTDGLAPLEEMLEAGARRRYAYYAVTDHAANLYMTGMSPEKVLEQRRKIGKLQERHPKMRILHGCELNIGPDGELDYDDEFLAGFDVLVASVHSHFNQPRDQMTKRVIRAIEHPCVNVIGHPTARMIGKRPPIDVDLEAVFEAAVRTGTALEVNSFPDRLDLRDEHIRWATERGVILAVNTDSHAPLHLEGIRFGVATAQRGWLTKDRTLNTWTLRRLEEFVKSKRARSK
jgi:DNA polymerase (family X)